MRSGALRVKRVDGGDPMSKLTLLLLSAAVLVALILLAYEMLLG